MGQSQALSSAHALRSRCIEALRVPIGRSGGVNNLCYCGYLVGVGGRFQALLISIVLYAESRVEAVQLIDIGLMSLCMTVETSENSGGMDESGVF